MHVSFSPRAGWSPETIGFAAARRDLGKLSMPLLATASIIAMAIARRT